MTIENGIKSAEIIKAVGPGFKFSIDLDTRLSKGMRRIAKADLVSHMLDARQDWTFQIVILKSENVVKVTESRKCK